MSDKFKSGIFFLLFFTGFLLAGSDGPNFPWPNLVGAAIAAIGMPLLPAVQRYGNEIDDE